mgnify:CR=1 FL=1|tara:strand:- start:128 stop:865 length:738 start_codon:yes stop_codon:yes gene_type:complete
MAVDLKQVALGILLLIVLYILYKIFSQKRPSLASARKLSGNEYEFTALSNPTSPNYYILMWVYVKNFDYTEDQILYTLKSLNSGGSDILRLQLKANGNLQYKTNDGSLNNIVNNFPLQKWTCIVLSVDGNKTIDCYLDGKIVKSKQENTPLSNTSEGSVIKEGSIEAGNDNDIRVATFKRIPQTMDPGTAGKQYIDGNGGSFMTKMFSSYGVSLRLNKDGTAHSSLGFPTGGISLGNADSNNSMQ